MSSGLEGHTLPGVIWAGCQGQALQITHSAHSSMFKVPSVHLNYFLSLSVHPESTISRVEPLESENTQMTGHNFIAQVYRGVKLPPILPIWNF